MIHLPKKIDYSLQERIERAVTNGRGYYPDNKLGLEKRKIDDVYFGLQASLFQMQQNSMGEEHIPMDHTLFTIYDAFSLQDIRAIRNATEFTAVYEIIENFVRQDFSRDRSKIDALLKAIREGPLATTILALPEIANLIAS